MSAANNNKNGVLEGGKTMLSRTGLLLLVIPGFAIAQDDPGPSDDEERAVEEIIVTGSRLPRRDFNSVSPIATVGQDVLDASALPNLEETLARMPQLAPDFDRTANNPGNGKAHINLRDMGASRSLVLINGQRMAPNGIGTAVDVNSLPKALIDRVEIITGGASTVYGSDAMAGVANFILRDDFDGLSLDVSTYMTERGDSNVNDINVAYGYNLASGRGNVTLYAGYLVREETYGSSRSITRVPLEDFGDGTIVQSGSSAVPAGAIRFPAIDLGDGPGQVIFEPDGELRYFEVPGDRYNYAPINYIQLPLERKSAGVIFDIALNDTLDAYGMFSYTNNRVLQNLAEVPAFGFFSINPDNPVLTPATQQIAATQFVPLEPGLVGFAIGRRLTELGPRIGDNDNDYTRLSVGVRGELNKTWSFDAWATYTKGEETVLFRNDASYSKIQQGLLVDPATGQCFDTSGGCVPVNLFGAGNLSPEAVDFIRLAPFKNVTSREQKLVSAFVRGAPLDSWAGPINMAFGLEWRSDDGDFVADNDLFLNDALGFTPDQSVKGSESVWEAYAEFAVPLAEGVRWAEYLGLELGGRYSRYRNAGSVDTWKLGAEWALPVPVRLRAMLQRSVRAPSIAEAFTEEGTSTGSYTGNNSANDPCSASRDPLNSGLADACVATGIPLSELGTWEATAQFPTEFYWGGNPGLGPEASKTFTAGVVFDADWLQGFQMSVDYFDIKIADIIGALDATAACFDVANTDQVFCDRLARDPASYNVIEVRENNINRGRLRTRGIDTAIKLEADLPGALALFGGAGLSVDLIWTHTFENSYQVTPFGTIFECAGQFGWPCEGERNSSTFPENRIMAGTTYHSGEFDLRLSWTWIDSTVNNLIEYDWVFGTQDFIWANDRVKDMLYVDLSTGYRFTDKLALRFNVENLMDEDPPLHVHNWCCNTDPKYYDYFGRAYSLSASIQF